MPYPLWCLQLLVSGGNSGSGGGCNDGGGGCVSLLEPLPSLLDAARKLVFLSREPGEGPAWLQEQEGGGGEGDAIMVDEEEEEAGGDVADDASVQVGLGSNHWLGKEKEGCK